MGPPYWEPNRAQRKTPLWGIIALCTVPAKPERWFQEELAKKEKWCSGFSFKVSVGNFIFFFHQKWPNKLKWWDLSVWDQILVPSLPPSQWFTEWIMFVPLMLKWPVICSFASLEERKLCFCHWFSHMKLISLPFSGSEAAVSKSAISLCFVSVSAGEILNSLCTKLFLNFVLFWNFASLGLGSTGHPIWL